VKKTLALATALSFLLSLALVAAPCAGTTWGTVLVRKDILTNLTQLLQEGNGTQTAPGLRIALFNQTEKARQDVADLYALDTSRFTDQEIADFVSALTELNIAMREAYAVVEFLGEENIRSSLRDGVNALVDYAIFQSGFDSRIETEIQNGPAGCFTWGTTSRIS